MLAHHEATEVALGLGENTPVDLVLGGHTHTNITGATEWGLSYLEPASYGKAYGYAELAFSAEDGAPVFQKVSKAQTVSVAGLPNTTENADELDPELSELTDKVLAALDEILSHTIGRITSPVLRLTYLPDSGNRSSTAGNWQSSIIARIAGADIGFVNGGGLRVEFELEEGQNGRDITLSDIYTMFPFDNTIYCYELTWGDLLAALEYSMTDGGARLLTDVSGIIVYYTDNTIRAIVTPEGLAVYANGEWREGWKEKTILVGLSNYIATTNRVSEEGLSNPFVAWNETERLIRSDQIDSECAIEVLTEEASMNGGLLSFDTTAHFINREYAGSASDKLPAPLSASDLNDAQKPTVRTNLTTNGKPQPLLIPPAGEVPEQYVLMYSIDGGKTWTTAVPYASAAGTYTVRMKFVSEIYEDIELNEVKVTVSPGQPTLPFLPVFEPIIPADPTITPQPGSDSTDGKSGTESGLTDPSFPFVDVSESDPFYRDILFVFAREIMNDVSETKFDPDGTLTRGMIVTILYRVEGSPATPYTGAFTDVPAGKWYTDGVECAASVGIVLGYGDGTYGVTDNVTREQLAAILYRYAKYKGCDVSIGVDTNILSYDDAFDISGWAMPSMQWACGAGVLNSNKTASIRPTKPATRGEIARAIHIFCESVAK